MGMPGSLQGGICVLMCSGRCFLHSFPLKTCWVGGGYFCGFFEQLFLFDPSIFQGTLLDFGAPGINWHLLHCKAVPAILAEDPLVELMH